MAEKSVYDAVLRKILLALVGFEDARGHEPRKAGSLQRLKMQRHAFSLRADRRNFDFSPVRPNLDF